MSLKTYDNDNKSKKEFTFEQMEEEKVKLFFFKEIRKQYHDCYKYHHHIVYGKFVFVFHEELDTGSTDKTWYKMSKSLYVEEIEKYHNDKQKAEAERKILDEKRNREIEIEQNKENARLI